MAKQLEGSFKAFTSRRLQDYFKANKNYSGQAYFHIIISFSNVY